jgi:hypothetical protein
MTDQEIAAVARAIREKVCVSDAHAIDIARAAIPSIRERVLEEAARVLAEIEPDEEAAGCAATWGDFVQIGQSTIRNLKEQG